MVKQKSLVRQTSVEIVEKVMANGAFADQVLGKRLARSPLSLQDRALVTELVNGTLRWHGQLRWIIARFFKGDYESCPTKLKTILEVTLYQLKFLDRIPDYAALSEGVEIAKTAGGNNWGKLVNGVLRSYLRSRDELKYPASENQEVQRLALETSHPRWLLERWISQYGAEETKAFCDWNNRRPGITVRAARGKTTAPEIIETFAKAGIEAVASDYFEDFVRVAKPRDLAELPAFRTGQFTIQDESTAIPSRLLEPMAGETVLDLCAAPGGKTCHLAQLMEERGCVIAVDRNHKRLTLLVNNIKRLKLQSVTPLVADATQLQIGPVDRILLDVPCSGLGVLSKRVDLRWKRKLNDIHDLKQLQAAILKNASSLLKHGGALVYSTCTLEPEETEEVIAEFLERNDGFEIEKGRDPQISRFLTSDGSYKSVPYVHNMDGVFAVKLKKVGA